VVLCHARRDPELSGLELQRDGRSVNRFLLSYPRAWAQAYPQSAHLLHEESLAWQKTPWMLKVDEV